MRAACTWELSRFFSTGAARPVRVDRFREQGGSCFTSEIHFPERLLAPQAPVFRDGLLAQVGAQGNRHQKEPPTAALTSASCHSRSVDCPGSEQEPRFSFLSDARSSGSSVPMKDQAGPSTAVGLAKLLCLDGHRNDLVISIQNQRIRHDLATENVRIPEP